VSCFHPPSWAILIFVGNHMCTQAVTREIRDGWLWKEYEDGDLSLSGPNSSSQDGWMPATSFPSEIHLELLKAGRIPDPFLGFNEHEVQWIGEREWLYRCSFHYDAVQTTAPWFSELEFEGLDTFCDVYLVCLSAYVLHRTALMIGTCRTTRRSFTLTTCSVPI